MVEIFDTIVTFELFEQMFCCDLAYCKGMCCYEGDSGAPLEKDEAEKITDILPKILSFLPDKSKQVIGKHGVSYIDIQGDCVTSIVDKKECVFAVQENGIYTCALEKAYNQKITDFPKPISCHLYPVRLEKFKNFTAVNFHNWEMCCCAKRYGKILKLPAYKFLKIPLIRRFGETWYTELESAAEAYYKEFH
ncbi:MAG: DUF3109 family protein [Prevotellaceae bacterium]|jgi:hypothetical protein|nr:DUF3109 family protein [Prevotellaceae bacterium]